MTYPKYIFGIDSATIVIPKSEVTFPNHILSEVSIKYIQSTGEEIDIREENHASINDNGIPTKYQIHPQCYVEGGDKIDVVKVTINAKQLGARYFEGINKYNFNYIQSYIESQNYIKVTPKGWDESYLRDVDFKIDIVLDKPENVDEQIKLIHNRTLDRLKQKGETVYKYFNNNNQNHGVEYYSRKRKRFKGAIKPKFQNTRVYAKEKELINKSDVFHQTYLLDGVIINNQFYSDFPISNILRVETWSGKNSKTFKEYAITSNRTNNVLDITMEQALPMFQKPFDSFLDFQKKPKVITNELSPSERNDYEWISMVLEMSEGINLSDVIEMYLSRGYNQVLSASQKSKKRRHLYQCYAKANELNSEAKNSLDWNRDLTFVIQQR